MDAVEVERRAPRRVLHRDGAGSLRHRHIRRFGRSGPPQAHPVALPPLPARSAAERLLHPRVPELRGEPDDGRGLPRRGALHARGCDPRPGGATRRVQRPLLLPAGRLPRSGTLSRACGADGRPRRGLRNRRLPALLSRGAAGAAGTGRRVPRRGRPRAGIRGRTAVGADRRREALRPGPRLGAGAEPPPERAARRAADLPHRPLPRQGDRPEHPDVPLRQRALRAALEPRAHRPRADHRGRVGGRRAPRGLLRPGGVPARHVPEPHAPAAHARGHGAPRGFRRRSLPRREAQAAAHDPALLHRPRRTGPVDRARTVRGRAR